MPEVVRALSQSLARSIGSPSSRPVTVAQAGVSQITGEVAKMVAQVPELFEALTGHEGERPDAATAGIEASAAPGRWPSRRTTAREHPEGTPTHSASRH